jgi:hypothetical protein
MNGRYLFVDVADVRRHYALQIREAAMSIEQETGFVGIQQHHRAALRDNSKMRADRTLRTRINPAMNRAAVSSARPGGMTFHSGSRR